MNNMHVSDVHIEILFLSHLHDSESVLSINFKDLLQPQNSELSVFLLKKVFQRVNSFSAVLIVRCFSPSCRCMQAMLSHESE